MNLYDTITIQELQDYDTLVTEKANVIGRIIQITTRGKVNHSGSYYRGNMYEADSTGFHDSTLLSFLEGCKKCYVLRPSFKVDKQTFYHRLKETMGKPYYFLGLLYNLIRQFSGKWYGGESTDAFMCSQASMYLLNEEQWWLFTPSDIKDYTKKFDIYELIMW